MPSRQRHCGPLAPTSAATRSAPRGGVGPRVLIQRTTSSKAPRCCPVIRPIVAFLSWKAAKPAYSRSVRSVICCCARDASKARYASSAVSPTAKRMRPTVMDGVRATTRRDSFFTAEMYRPSLPARCCSSAPTDREHKPYTSRTQRKTLSRPGASQLGEPLWMMAVVHHRAKTITHKWRPMISRREWLGRSLGAGATLALTPELLRALQALQQPSGKLIQRAIPSSGEMLPAVGLSFSNHVSCADPAALREVLKVFADNGGRVFDALHVSAP